MKLNFFYVAALIMPLAYLISCSNNEDGKSRNGLSNAYTEADYSSYFRSPQSATEISESVINEFFQNDCRLTNETLPMKINDVVSFIKTAYRNRVWSFIYKVNVMKSDYNDEEWDSLLNSFRRDNIEYLRVIGKRESVFFDPECKTYYDLYKKYSIKHRALFVDKNRDVIGSIIFDYKDMEY